MWGPNGSGKTTILHAARYALTGKPPEGRSLEKLIHDGADTAAVEMDFCIDGGRSFRVQRTISPSSVLLVELEDDGTETELARKAGEANGKIADLCECPPRYLSDHAFVRQGDMSGWVEQTASKRSEALSDLLGLDVAARAYSRAGDQIRALSASIGPDVDIETPTAEAEAVADRLSDLSDRLQALPDDLHARVEELRDELAQAVAAEAIPDAAKTRRRLEDITEKLHEYSAAVAEHSAELEDLPDVEASLAVLADIDRYEELSKTVAELQAHERKLLDNEPPDPGDYPDELAARVLELEEATKQVTRVTTEFSALRKYRESALRDGNCRVCFSDSPDRDKLGQVLAGHDAPSHNGWDRYRVSQVEDELAEADAVWAKQSSAREAWEQRLEVVRLNLGKAVEERGQRPPDPPVSRESVESVESRRARLLSSLKRDQREVDRLNSQREILQAQLEEAGESITPPRPASAVKADLQQARADLAARSELEFEVRDAANELTLAEDRLSRATEARDARRQQQGAIRRLKAARALLSPSGAPGDVLRESLASLAQLMNPILASFEADFCVEVLADANSPEFRCHFEDDRGERSDRELSGGEKVLLSWALRAALDAAIGQLKFLALDEPASGLDDKNMGLLRVALAGLRGAEGGCPQVLFVTHDTELASLFGHVVDVQPT